MHLFCNVATFIPAWTTKESTLKKHFIITNTRIQLCWYTCTYNSHWSWWSDWTGCCRVAAFSVGLGRSGTRPAPLVCWRPQWWLFCLTPGYLDCSLSGSWPVGSEVVPLWKRIAHVLPLVCCSVRNLKKKYVVVIKTGYNFYLKKSEEG